MFVNDRVDRWLRVIRWRVWSTRWRLGSEPIVIACKITVVQCVHPPLPSLCQSLLEHLPYTTHCLTVDYLNSCSSGYVMLKLYVGARFHEVSGGGRKFLKFSKMHFPTILTLNREYQNKTLHSWKIVCSFSLNILYHENMVEIHYKMLKGADVSTLLASLSSQNETS